MADEKRRNFLKHAGVFAGTLGAISILKSDVANAAVSFAGGSFNPLRFLDDGTAEFDHGNNKAYMTSDGNLALSKLVTASYTFGGGVGSLTQVPLPPGMYYPMGDYWGYNYNFVKNISVNGTPASFSEFDLISMPPNTGNYAYEGFSWGVKLSSSVDPGDVVEATVEHRELFASVKGVRAGWKFMPDSMDEQSYQYPVRKAADDPSVPWGSVKPLSPTGDNKIYWSWPNTSNYSIIVWNMSKFHQAGYQAAGPKGAVKIGKRWKTAKNKRADQYADGLEIQDLFSGATARHRAARLAVFHKPTGAMSMVGSDLIINGLNRKATADGSWGQTVKLK